VGSYIPYETGHPVEGQPNLGKVIELTMNNGFDPRTKKQVGPKTGDPEDFKDFEELYAAFEGQLKFTEEVLRRGATATPTTSAPGASCRSSSWRWRWAPCGCCSFERRCPQTMARWPGREPPGQRRHRDWSRDRKFLSHTTSVARG